MIDSEAPTSRRVGNRRAAPLLVVALLVTLLVCGWQASLILRFRSPSPDVTVALGVPIVVGGVSYRLDTFEVAERFPAKMADDDPVVALPGAKLVKIIFTEEVVDPGRDLSTIYCDLSVGVADGRRWTTSDDGYRISLPEAPTCSGSSEHKAALRDPFQVGGLFEVPTPVADETRFLLRLSTERQLVEFTR